MPSPMPMLNPIGPVATTTVARVVVPATLDAARAEPAAANAGAADAPASVTAPAVAVPSSAAQPAFSAASAADFSPLIRPFTSPATLNATLVRAAPPSA